MNDELKYERTWYAYLVQCSDTTYYCGISKNVNQRVDNHNLTKCGAKYTRTRRPVTLVWKSPPKTHREAAQLEYKIKKMTRRQKEILIVTNNLSLIK